MAKPLKRFVCQSCGAVTSKWGGRCESCGEWNTIVEEAAPAPGPAGGGMARAGKGRTLEFAGLRGSTPQPDRYRSGIAEFDRVCGGGLVVGSALLIGGDPGIGKSTLLLQVAAALARQHTACAYISGEEALDQVRLRGERLGLGDAPVQLTAATSVRDIVATLERPDAPKVAVIDSIQTMWLDTIDSTPGTVSQVRGSAQALVELAKRRGIAVLLVGHVTKDGAIAGPRVLEHMVDTVLYFEGERGHHFRILRTVKNRFGPTDEIGVFEMSDRGLSRRRQSLGAVPRRAARPRLGHLRVRRHRGHAAGAGRDPGAGRRPPPSARRGVPWSAGIPTGWPWCWPCSRRAAASPSAPTTSISTSPAACASASRRPISPSLQPWCHRSPTSRCRPTWSCSARSVWAARCVR